MKKLILAGVVLFILLSFVVASAVLAGDVTLVNPMRSGDQSCHITIYGYPSGKEEIVRTDCVRPGSTTQKKTSLPVGKLETVCFSSYRECTGTGAGWLEIFAVPGAWDTKRNFTCTIPLMGTKVLCEER